MRAIVIKEVRELMRDRRTVAMLLVIPIILLVVFGYAANFTVDKSEVLITGPGAGALAQELEQNTAASEDLAISTTDTELTTTDIQDRLRDQETHAIIRVASAGEDNPIAQRTHVYIDGSELFQAQAVQRAWMRVIAEDSRSRITAIREDIEAAKADAQRFADEIATVRTQADTLRAAMQSPPAGAARPQGVPAIEVPTIPTPPALPDTDQLSLENMDIEALSTVYFNPDLETSWMMVPGLIGVIMTFIGVVVTSIGLVREREAGTLEQLAVMPLRPSAIIMGKIIPYFVLSLLDAAVITALGVWIFDVPFEGNMWLYSLFAFIFMFVVLGLGVFISSISQTTGQAIQLSIMTVVPQIMLSGLIFPLELMAANVRWIGYGLPLTWFIQISRGIMLRDAQLDQLLLPAGVLIAMAVLFFGGATLNMRLLLRKGGATS